MKSKQGLMTALVGIAMIALPITAKAADNGQNWRRARETHALQGSRYCGSPAAQAAAESTARAHGNHWWNRQRWLRNEANSNAMYGSQTMAPAGYAMPVAYQNPNYGSGYAAAPLMSPYMGGGAYAGGGQNQLMSEKEQAQAQYAAALRSHNNGAIKAARKNLNEIDRQIARTNFRTSGVPYARYGSNSSQEPLHKRLLNGLFGSSGYNAAPAYGNGQAYNNYNGGGALPGIAAYQNFGRAPVAPAYGTPYASGGSSMLAPLLQNFVR